MNRKHPPTPSSLGRRSSDSSRRNSGGFSALDPSKMGFDVPDWMEEPSADAAGSDTSSELADTSPNGRSADTEVTPPAPSRVEERTLLEGMKVVCICKGIKKRVFWKALDDGISTKEEINRCTGSGSGGCQGRRCGPRILDMLRNASL